MVHQAKLNSIFHVIQIVLNGKNINGDDDSQLISMEERNHQLK